MTFEGYLPILDKLNAQHAPLHVPLSMVNGKEKETVPLSYSTITMLGMLSWQFSVITVCFLCMVSFKVFTLWAFSFSFIFFRTLRRVWFPSKYAYTHSLYWNRTCVYICMFVCTYTADLLFSGRNILSFFFFFITGFKFNELHQKKFRLTKM